MMQVKPISVYSIRGLWSVEGTLEYEPVKQEPASEKMVSEAIDVLRLIVGSTGEPEKDHAYLVSVTFQPTRLVMRSPVTQEQINFDLKGGESEMNLWAIDPGVENSEDHLHLVAYQSEISWSLEQENWPAEVTQVYTESGAELTSTAWLQHHIGLSDKTTIRELTWISDGVVFQGEMCPPWDFRTQLSGTWKLGKNSDQWTLMLEGNATQWRQSLIVYQDQVVEATDLQFQSNQMPSNSSPFVGLIASGLPEQLLWTLRDGTFDFDPGGTLFIIELRGSGMSTARVIPGEITIGGGGVNVGLTWGEVPAGQSDVLTYHYQNLQRNAWAGNLPLVLEGDSVNGYRNALNDQQNTDWEEPLKAWILTPTGPLQIPIADEVSPSESEHPYQPLKGLLRLNQMTWQEDEVGSASPDITKSSNMMLLVLGHRGLEVNVHLNWQEDTWHCTELIGKIRSPEFRLESALPIFLPDEAAATIAQTPPKLPDLSDEGAVDNDRILTLSFHNGPESAEATTLWNLDLDFSPGVGPSPGELLEGSWSGSDLVLPKPQETNWETAYWYKVPKADLIPIYPFDVAPVASDLALRASRMLMPFRVDTQQPTVLSLVEQQFSGSLFLPELATKQQLFGWFSPALPGLSLHPLVNSPILVQGGFPTAGQVQVRIYHELPGLYELFALQDASEPEEEPPSFGKRWWEKLAIKHALAMSEAQLLCITELPFQYPNILEAHQHPVILQDLLGPTSISGVLNLLLSEQQASLNIRAASDFIPLIREEQWLRGAQTTFKSTDSNTLEPCLPTDATGELVAGTLPPQKLSNDVVLDGFGNLQSSQVSPLKWIEIPGEEQHNPRYVQWTEVQFEAIDGLHQLSLFWKDIPLRHQPDGTLVFSAEDEWVSHPLLRDYSWGTPISSVIGGLKFQLMRLDKIVASVSGSSNVMPLEIELSGVLHLRDETINAANPEHQQVKIVWKNEQALRWVLSHVEGRVVWPFFEHVPDVYGAKEELSQTLPYLEASVGIEQSQLFFGIDGAPALWVLELFGRKWDIPINVTAISPDQLDFEVIEVPGEGIHPIGGSGTLDRSDYKGDAQLDLALLIKWSDAEPRDVGQLFWSYLLDESSSGLSITEARLLQVDAGAYLATYDVSDDLKIEAGNEHLSILFGRPDVINQFDWLPGIPFDTSRPWHGFLSFALPASGGTIRELIPSTVDLLLSGAADEQLDFTFTYHASGINSTRLSLSLTGIIEIQSVFKWPLGELGEAHHLLTAYLNQAQLKDAQLRLSERPGVFFDLAEDQSYVAFPALITHRLVPITGQQNGIQWTVPQDLRLVRASQIFELINDRGWPPGIAVLLRERNTMDEWYWEAGEAHWLHAPELTGSSDTASVLWVQRGIRLEATPTREVSGPFLRLTIPALAGFQGALNEWISSDPELEKAFRVSLDGLSIDKEITAYQWDALPYVSKPASGVDGAKSVYANSEVAPIAYNTLLPFLRSNSDFHWGQLVFDEKTQQSFLWEADHIELPNKWGSGEERRHKHKHGWDRRVYREIEAIDEGMYWLVFHWQTEKHKQTLWIEGQHTIMFYDLPHLQEKRELMIPIWLKAGKQELLFSMKTYRGSIHLTDLTLSDDFKLSYGQRWEASEAIDKSNQWVNEVWGKPSRKPKRPFRHAPISQKESMTFAWDIPENGSYWLEVNMATVRDHQDIRIYEGNKRLSAFRISNTKDWDNYHSTWVQVELKKGRRKLRFTAWGWLGYRLKYVNLLQGIRQQKYSQPAMLQTVLTLEKLAQYEGSTLSAAIEKLPKSESDTSIVFEKLIDSEGTPKAMAWQSAWTNLRMSTGPTGDLARGFQFKVQVIGIREGWGWYEVGSRNFVIGLSPDQTWQQLLGLSSDLDQSENLILKAVSDWVSETSGQAPGGALIVARSLSMGSHLEDEKWFSVGSRKKLIQSLVQNTTISAIRPLIRDLHWESLELEKQDPLSKGPDYLDGEVYYEPGEWSNPDFLELPVSADSRLNFKAEPLILKLGETVTLSWRTQDFAPDTSLLLVDEKTSVTHSVTNWTELTLSPRETTIYALKAFDSIGDEIDSARLRVGVRRLVSGSGVGFSWQLSGAPAGYWHESRDVSTDDENAYHRWLEWSREVAFQDLTRQGVNEEEIGTILPKTRTLPDLPLMKNLMPARASTLSTNGRPGSKQWWRLSFLRAYHQSKSMQRTSGFGVSTRFPRPVPSPEHFWIHPPKFGLELLEARTFSTCSVAPGYDNENFASFHVYWADPMYDHQLLAVIQSRTQEILQLTLDRKVYGPKDVFYPEIKLLADELPDAQQWRVVLTVTLMRPQSGRLFKRGEITASLREGSVLVDDTNVPIDRVFEEVYSPDNKKFRRYVLEMGLDKPGEGSLLLELLHQDVLLVYARLETPQRNYEVNLQAQVNAEEPIWSPPSNATTLFRKIGEDTRTLTHAWAVPPVEVKRFDRFRPDSWSGLFHYQDVMKYAELGVSEIEYEVRSTTPYGEQPIHKTFSR